MKIDCTFSFLLFALNMLIITLFSYPPLDLLAVLVLISNILNCSGTGSANKWRGTAHSNPSDGDLAAFYRRG